MLHQGKHGNSLWVMLTPTAFARDFGSVWPCVSSGLLKVRNCLIGCYWTRAGVSGLGQVSRTSYYAFNVTLPDTVNIRRQLGGIRREGNLTFGSYGSELSVAL